MTPNTALWLILTIVVVQIAIGAPLAWHFRQKMQSIKIELRQYAPLGIVAALLGVIVLGLWWYYATSTDQILLAVIPTVSLVWGWMMRGLMKMANS